MTDHPEHTSRIPGFYRLALAERRRQVCARTPIQLQELEAALQAGGLDLEIADKVVENVLGTYSLPFGVALNVLVNGRDYLVPMVVEEPSVIAAASNAARLVRLGGGFTAEVVESLMIGQVQLFGVSDAESASAQLRAATTELLELAELSVPGLVGRGGGPRAIEVRNLGDGYLVLHVLVDCRDAMGANLVNTIAEAVGPRAAELANAQLGLRILSNLSDRRRVRASCRVPKTALVSAQSKDGAQRRFDVDQVLDGIAQASRFAELDPYRAATHNKGVMNGIDAVVLATGNDFRAVEAGAHAYAARSGTYQPLAVWRRDGDDLLGTLEMPLALGTVGGTLRVHTAAQLALRIMHVESADELIAVTASIGLASNLAALKALATEGIQRGHMSLHARSVAIAAGARGDEVEAVALSLSESGVVTLESALGWLEELRREEGGVGEPDL